MLHVSCCTFVLLLMVCAPLIKKQKCSDSLENHRVLQGAAPRGPQFLLLFLQFSGPFLHAAKCQDKFDYDKGQKSAISGRRLHWRLSTGFFLFLQYLCAI